MTNKIEINPADRNKIVVHIIGDNNVVVIKKMSEASCGKVSISLAANNSSIVLDEGIYVGAELNILVGQVQWNFGVIENAHIYIGKNTGVESVSIVTFNSNASVFIGDRCMFSYGITIYHTDAHPIMNAESGEIVNKVKSLKIGNHVWVGANATILKNTIIPDDCIVGWGSVVNAGYAPPPSYIKQNCIIAGNPAKVVKTGVSWDSDGSKGYVQNGGVTAQVSKRAASLIAHANFSMPEGNFVFCLPNRILYQIWRHLDENAVEFNVKPRTFYNKIRYKLWKHFSKKMY